MIACTRMYNVHPAVQAAWATLLSRVAVRSGIALDVIEHAAPAPLEALWARADLGCAFMCGWPFVRSRPQPGIVAAPVPRGARYGGRAVYFTDFVVRSDRGFTRLEDTFGTRLAWTVDGSHSGFNAPRYHLLTFRSHARPVLFRGTVGPVITPRGALDAVREGRADVAPLDSYALDLIRRHDPRAARGIVVLESTLPAPIPPLVAAPDAPPDAVLAMREALLGAASDPDFTDCLDILELSGFESPPPGDYDVIAERDRVARATGYPYPA